jgi:hypothetical protein
MKGATTHGAIACTLLIGVAYSSAQADQALTTTVTDTTTSQPGSLREITVTAQRLELLGTADTASEGVVDDQELQLAQLEQNRSLS